MAKQSLQTNSKNYPECWEEPCRDILILKPFCFESYWYLNLYDTISFDMSCFSLLYAVLPLYCFFETCKVNSVLKLYFEAVEKLFYIPIYQFSQPFPEQINAKQKLFFNSKLSKKVIPSLCLYSKQKSRKKQPSNKVTQEAILKACVYKKHCNTKTVTVKPARNNFIFELIKLIFGYFVLFIKNLY